MSTILLDNVNADTTSDTFTFNQPSAILVVRADDYDSGTVTLEVASTSDNRFTVLDDATFTADGTKKIDLTIPGLEYRAVLSGSTSPVNVKVEMI